VLDKVKLGFSVDLMLVRIIKMMIEDEDRKINGKSAESFCKRSRTASRCLREERKNRITVGNRRVHIQKLE